MLISHTLSSTVIYVIVSKCCKGYFDRKLSGNKFYRFVTHEGKNKPYKVGLMIRFIAILNYALKNIICSLGGIHYFAYMITYIPLSMQSATMYL